MSFWLCIYFAVLAEGLAHWEPCKVQCDDNFKRNEMIQQASLINVCKRGCDLFTVAYISTSSNSINQDKVENSKDLIKDNDSHQFDKLIVVDVVNTPERRNDKEPIKSEKKNPSIVFKQNGNKKDDHEVNKLSHHRKTTEEPTSQPVQDHPVEAGKQTTTTTTNGLKRDPLKPVTFVRPKNNENKEIGDIIFSSNEEKIVPKKYEVNKKEITHSQMQGRLEQAKHSCRHACVSAYGGASEQEACVVGCHLQATTASLRTMDELNSSEKGHPKTAIGMFQHVMFSLASHVGRLVRITWSWGSTSSVQNQEAQSNKIHTYGSEGLTRRAQLPLFIGLRQSYVAEPQKRPEMIKLEANQGPSFINDEKFHLPRPLEDAISNHHNIPGIITIIKEETKNLNKETNEKLFDKLKVFQTINKKIKDESQSNHQLDLLECISRKSGLPRWFIAIAIFVSALVVLWLCFSLTAPPDDIKVVKTKPPENECLVDDDEFDDDVYGCSEKKNLLPMADDVIKIRIENV